MPTDPFCVSVTPDWEGLLRCLRRQGPAKRVHHIELFHDGEVEEALIRRYGILDGLKPDQPHFDLQRHIRLRRFLGFDYVSCGLADMPMPMRWNRTDDTADLPRAGGRSYVDLHEGPITNWQQFEAYPWPDPSKASSAALEWYERNLPDDMCVIGMGVAHYAEYLSWLMGYETLCFALADQRDLVEAIYRKALAIDEAVIARLLQFSRVKAIWGSDDMGFRTGPLISPDDLRRFVLPGHKRMAQLAHDAGRPYLLHSCGNLESIMDDLLDEVKIDAKHSYEDVIEPVERFSQRYGRRVAIMGGIDLDFLCRSDEPAIRRRVRQTLDACMPGGGYCLGTGNSVTNYIPLDHYLAMLDEGRKWRA